MKLKCCRILNEKRLLLKKDCYYVDKNKKQLFSIMRMAFAVVCFVKCIALHVNISLGNQQVDLDRSSVNVALFVCRFARRC